MSAAESAFDVLKEKWDHVRAAIKARWGDKITDAELDAVAGQHEKLCHLIGDKCTMRVHEARGELNKILDGIASTRF